MSELASTIIIIFGASGDLARRKLLPALYNLFLDGFLPENFSVLGVDHNKWSLDQYRDSLLEDVDRFSRRGKADRDDWKRFALTLDYLSLDFMAGDSYRQVANELEKKAGKWQTRPVCAFYLATGPSFVETIVRQLDNVGLLRDRERSRVVIEKPFGRDSQSAKHLSESLLRHLEEPQIFRIDHFLGKETVQNILAFRFANSLFEPLWNRTYIDHVQVTVSESLGVESRGHYYETAGALRDMLENHLFQLLGLVAMEAPTSLGENEIRNKKVDVLRAIRPITKSSVPEVAVRGQYGAGEIEQKAVRGYRDEENVAADSPTETFAALKLFIDNWRWQDVPFYLRTGKRMAEGLAEISLKFKPVPHRCFPENSSQDWGANQLLLQIQPKEEITLCFQAKQPGAPFELKPVSMKFCYRSSFSRQSPEAYETLLLDIFSGDATSFVRADLEDAAWSVIAPILEVWEAERPSEFPNYRAGSWGPEAANALLARDGRAWRCK